jgi:hypothetical protein
VLNDGADFLVYRSGERALVNRGTLAIYNGRPHLIVEPLHKTTRAQHSNSRAWWKCDRNAGTL